MRTTAFEHIQNHVDRINIAKVQVGRKLACHVGSGFVAFRTVAGKSFSHKEFKSFMSFDRATFVCRYLRCPCHFQQAHQVGFIQRFASRGCAFIACMVCLWIWHRLEVASQYLVNFWSDRSGCIFLFDEMSGRDDHICVDQLEGNLQFLCQGITP